MGEQIEPRLPVIQGCQIYRPSMELHISNANGTIYAINNMDTHRAR